MSDELDAVRRLTPAPPPFDVATDQRVRARMAELLRDSGDDLPDGWLDPDDEGVVLHLDRRRARPKTSPTVRWVAWAAVAAIVIVVGVVLARPQGEEPPSMEEMAVAAASGPHATIVDGQVLQTVTEQQIVGLSRTRFVKRIRPDSSGTEQVTDLDGGGTTTIDYGPGEMVVGAFPYATTQALPSDPEALRATIIDLTGTDAPGPTIRTLTEVLSTTATPPDTRAAAVRLLQGYGADATQDRDDRPQIVIVDPAGKRIVVDIDLDQGVATRLAFEQADTGQLLEDVRYPGTTVEPD